MFLFNASKRTIAILVIFCYVTARSFTLQLVFPSFKRTISPSSLLFSQHETSEFAFSDSELIQSLIRAKTTKDVDQTLRDAMIHTNNNTTNDNNNNNADFLDHFSFNVSAAALRRMALVSVMESREKTADLKTQNLRTQLLTSLLETIGSQMVLASDSPGRLINIYALADVFSALAILQQNDFMQPLASLVVQMMKRHDTQDLFKLGPIRLLQCLQSLARLQLDEHQFRNVIYQRLLKPDAVSKLPARSLSHGLAALAESDMNDRDPKLLSRAFMRRLRKQKVREQASISDLCRALVAADQIFKKEGMEEFRDEAAVFGFTSLRVIMQKKNLEQASLTPKQISDLIYSWSRLSNNRKEDIVIEELLDICKQEGILDNCNPQELERIIGSVERLQITNHSETMRLGGERLLDLVREKEATSALHTLTPKNINGILRCPVLLHRRNKTVMRPYIEAASHLFHDETFVAACSLSEIANFLWFKSIANWRDDEVLELFCRRILDPDIADSCSPKLASRVLGAFTLILSLKRPNNVVHISMLDTTSQLFHSYGGHLLTSKLQPAEASSALYAYARASYIQDMGIFDHLVSLTASMADQCTARQLSQSLWSCGKMVEFEQIEFDEDKAVRSPPYLENAISIAQELCSRSNELTSADVTQCIWALARLGVRDDSILHPLTARAMAIANSMNTIEATNILWGLGKIRYIDLDLTSILTEKLTKTPRQASPKQAASALYALGRLQVKDKELYDTLSLSLVDQIHDTSAHAIANVLWAYKTVNLKPPEELLNLWASEKLGLLVGVQFRKPSDDG
jgi:hypothetical protein